MKNTNSKLILTGLLSFAILFFANGQQRGIKERADRLIETDNLITVKGTVTAFDTYYLKNAEVSSRKTGAKAFTDSLGSFEIMASSGDVLVFRANGFKKSRTELTPDEDEINVDMILMPGEKNEQKAVAFGHMFEQDIKYALEHSRSNNNGIKMFSNLRGLIQSELLEATVTDQGSIQVFIRGMDTNPLGSSENNGAAIFVLDGMIISDIDFLSPTDVKSVRLLKGVQATNKYGSRGVNGAVLISTR